MYKTLIVYTHQGDTYTGLLKEETDRYIVLEDCSVDDCETITRLKEAKIYKNNIAYQKVTRY